jgi:predicted HAD superfamily Cof-like phosphohydrolase
MKNLMRDVGMLHTAADQPIRTTPTLIDDFELALRKRLINEEVNKELLPAMDAGDLVGITDGIADSIYVLVGTALFYGIPLDNVWDAVQFSNMAKADPITGKMMKDAGGKGIKPPGWRPPDIASILIEAGWTPPE